MEPFTMMLGYGLINSLSQLVIRPLSEKMSVANRQTSLQMQEQLQTKHKLDIETIRLNKQIERENQMDIQAYCHQCRMKEAQTQFERQLQMWQIGKFNDQMWPLLTPFDHPSLRPQQSQGGQTPLNVFLASTAPHTPFAELVQPDLKIRLSHFLQTSYSSDPSQSHPTICRIGDWKAGYQDAAYINALWYGMQGVPSIVVNPMQAEFGDKLDLTVSMWGLGETGSSPKMQNVMSGDFGSAIGKIKRDKSKEWIDRGLPTFSSEMQHNAKLLEQEKEMIAKGNEQYVNLLYIQYKLPKEIQNDVITTFTNEYNHIISCITGMYADIFHMMEYGAAPYMPTAIEQYNLQIGMDFAVPDFVCDCYHHALTSMACTNYLQDKLPYVYMDVAQALSFNIDIAKKIFMEGVGLWINKKAGANKETSIPTTMDDAVSLLYSSSTIIDAAFVEKTKNVLFKIEPEAFKLLQQKEKEISLPLKESQEESTIEETETIYDEIIPSYNSFCLVRKEGLWGLIQCQGDIIEVIPCSYSDLKLHERNTEDCLIAGKKIGDELHYGIISLNGKEIVPFIYDEIQWAFNAYVYNYFCCRKSETFYVINSQIGQIVLTVKATKFLPGYEKCGFLLNNRLMLYNKNIYLEKEYTNVEDFRFGEMDNFFIKSNGRWVYYSGCCKDIPTFVLRKGEELIKMVHYGSETSAVVIKKDEDFVLLEIYHRNNKEEILKNNGKYPVDFIRLRDHSLFFIFHNEDGILTLCHSVINNSNKSELSIIGEFLNIRKEHEELIVFQNTFGKYGVMDNFFNKKISPIFEGIKDYWSDISRGQIYWSTKVNGKWGIHPNGIPPIWDRLEKIKDCKYVAQNNGTPPVIINFLNEIIFDNP